MLSLAGWLAITFAAAAVGGIASIDAPLFYRDITLPAWAPPGWVFGPVWTVLYLLMGTAAWLIGRLAGVMLLPYLLWVSFATALTLPTWRLNPDVLG